MSVHGKAAAQPSKEHVCRLLGRNLGLYRALDMYELSHSFGDSYHSEFDGESILGIAAGGTTVGVPECEARKSDCSQ
jgi:hypothetical protein